MGIQTCMHFSCLQQSLACCLAMPAEFFSQGNLRKHICSFMQEVQSNHFDNFLSPELQKAGYTAIYKRKTTELYTGNAYAIDGCATFFKRDKFALVKKYEVMHV